MQVVLELYQKQTMADFAIINYDALDDFTRQELIEFALERGGFFREDLKRFSIKKCADITYLQQIFSFAGLDVELRKPFKDQERFATTDQTLKEPREAEEVIGFGKHKGQTWGEVPMQYLKWVQGAMQGHNAEIAKKMMFYKKTVERRERESKN